MEPSLSPGDGGSAVTFHGGIYSGSLPAGSSLIELGDPPGEAGPRVRGSFSVDYVDFWSSEKNPADSVIRCRSARWSGELLNTDQGWNTGFGLLHFDGVPNTGAIHTHTHDQASLPTKGTWYAGCHTLDMPDDSSPGSLLQYRCVQTGAYGTPTEPRWAQVKGAKK